MQTVTKNSLFLGHGFPVAGLVGFPVAGRSRDQVKLHHRDGQTIQDALPFPAQIQTAQEHAADQIDGSHQVPPASIETALRGNMRKQMAIVSPVT